MAFQASGRKNTRTSHRRRGGQTTLRIACALSVVGCVALIAVGSARAQAPAFLVKNINQQPVPISSAPGDAVAIGDRAFFVARGRNLAVWTTDGTAAGTRVVKPIRLRSFGSPSLAAVGGRVFFKTVNGDALELWTTDGTDAGTARVAVIDENGAGPVDSDAYLFTAVGDALYFITRTNEDGTELWRSDGTDPGTHRVKVLDCCAEKLIDVDGTLFFTANNYDLWRSDGSEAGTGPIVDADGNPLRGVYEFVSIGSRLFFSALDPAQNSPQLWAINAQDTIARQVTHLAPGQSAPLRMTNVAGSLYFFVPNHEHDPGVSLWTSDGSEAGTVKMADLEGVLDEPSFTADLNGRLLFSDAGSTGARQLWISDGTRETTHQLTGGNADFAILEPKFIAGDGVAYFAARDGAAGDELWITDGTEAGTHRVRDIRPGELGSNAAPLVLLGRSLLFSANDGLTGMELWQSDGTEAGTMLLANLAEDGAAISEPIPMADIGGQLFFTANDGLHGRELWKSDGTDAGTVLVSDIRTGPDGSNLYGGVGAEDRFFFPADDGESGVELWNSDGTPGGTTRVADIAAGMAAASISELTIVGDILLFAASDGVTGVELWRSDGTAAGTALVADINPGAASSQPHSLTVLNDVLLFFADDGVHGVELWKSDGTAQGTALIQNTTLDSVMQRTKLVYGGELVAIPDAGAIFFFASDAIHGTELWKSDGTPEHTALVADINPGPDGSRTGDENIVVLGNRAVFTADDGVHGDEIWTSDGTAAGTVLVKDILPGSSSSLPSLLTKVGEEVFFIACTPATGSEIWKSDGSSAGTVLVREQIPGPYSLWDGYYGNCSFPAGLLSAPAGRQADATTSGDGSHFRPPQLSVVQNHLLFHEIPSGALFESNGTAGGTRVLASLGVWGAVVAAGPLAYFNAGFSSLAVGDLELWAIPLANIDACGNGVLDAGEACDTGGDSPTCNADCTLPDCGDGLINRAAGEECDDGNDEDDDCCLKDCTPRAADTPCTDWNACTAGDECDGSGHCAAGAVQACSDGQAFTRDWCTADQGCVNTDGCWGDCDGNGSVVVNELLTVVRLALGQAAPSECASGVASTQRVDIVTLIRAVYNTLNGCTYV